MPIFYSRIDTTNNEILPEVTLKNVILDNYETVSDQSTNTTIVQTALKTNYINFSFDVTSILTNLDSVIKDYEYLQYIKFLIIPTNSQEQQSLIDAIKSKSPKSFLIQNLKTNFSNSLELVASSYCDAEITKRILNTNDNKGLRDNNFNFTLQNSFNNILIAKNYLTLNLMVYFDAVSFCNDNKIIDQLQFVDKYFGDIQHHIYYLLSDTRPSNTEIIEGVLSDYRIIKNISFPTLSVGSKTTFITSDNVEKNFNYFDGIYQSNNFKDNIYNFALFDYDLFIKNNTIVDDVQQGIESSNITLKISRAVQDIDDNLSIIELETAIIANKNIVTTKNNLLFSYIIQDKMLLCLVDNHTAKQANNIKYQYIFEVIYKDKLIHKLYNPVNQTGLFFDMIKIINKYEVLTNFALQKVDSGNGSYVNKYGMYTDVFLNSIEYQNLRPATKEIEYLFTTINHFIKNQNEKFTQFDILNYIESLSFNRATLELHLIFLKNINVILSDIENILKNQSLSIINYIKTFNVEFAKYDIFYSISNNIKSLPLIPKSFINSYYTSNSLTNTNILPYLIPNFLTTSSKNYSFENFNNNDYSQEIVNVCVSLLNDLLSDYSTDTSDLENLLDFYSCIVTKNSPNITSLLQSNKRQLPMVQGNSSFKKEVNTVEPLSVQISNLASKPRMDVLSPLTIPKTLNSISDSSKILFELLFTDLKNSSFELNKQFLSPSISLYYY